VTAAADLFRQELDVDDIEFLDPQQALGNDLVARLIASLQIRGR